MIFRLGYCYDDFYKTPNAGDWIMRPELSTVHLDIEEIETWNLKKGRNYSLMWFIWRIA